MDLPRSRPGFPGGVMLLGETENNLYLALQVDTEDRLVMAVASLDYIARTVQLLGTSAAVLEDTVGYCVEVNIVNVTGVADTGTLYYSSLASPANTEIIWQGSVPARTYSQISVYLEIGTKKLFAMAASANTLYALCTLHRGRDYVRT